MARRLRIRLVNRYDVSGGAEVVARDQLRKFRARGHDATLLVGEKRSEDPAVVQLGTPGDSDRRREWKNALDDADVVHFHNLHGAYFDTRLLPDLCRRSHVAVTLHDQYLFT